MAQQWRWEPGARRMADERHLHDQQWFSIWDYGQFLWILQWRRRVVGSSHDDRQSASVGLPPDPRSLVWYERIRLLGDLPSGRAGGPDGSIRCHQGLWERAALLLQYPKSGRQQF